MNQDHVFGEAFGGKAKVWVHEACNSSMGAGPEGRLHRANSFLNVFASLRGIAKQEVVGTTPNGSKVSADLSKGSAQPARLEVEISETRGTIVLQATGREEHLKKIVNDWRKKHGEQIPRWADLTPAQRITVQESPRVVEVVVSLDLSDAEAFAAKVALGAGVLAFGPDYAGSTLAASLRAWVKAPFDNPLLPGSANPRTKFDALAALDAQFAALATQMSSSLQMPTIPTLVNADIETHQVVFAGVGGRTNVFVQILGAPIPPYGLNVAGEAPGALSGMPSLAVLVRERSGVLEKTDFGQLLMMPVVQSAKAAAQIRHDG
jgi:hypothetical protein